MPLTRDFSETVKARAEADPKFRRLLLLGVLELLRAGEVGAAKVLLRDLVHTHWDADAKVWVANIEDGIVGLATEADTLEELSSKVLVMVEELAELNG